MPQDDGSTMVTVELAMLGVQTQAVTDTLQAAGIRVYKYLLYINISYSISRL